MSGLQFDELEPQTKKYIDEGLKLAVHAAWRWLDKCESPIERIFAAALWALHTPGGPEGWRAQVEIGPYRIDFVYTYDIDGIGVPAKVAVELDGHEFHERTKEQARRDKAKDRYLQQLGYYIFRYTGSEIVNDPAKCIGEVMRFADDKYTEVNRFADIEKAFRVISEIKRASNAGIYPTMTRRSDTLVVGERVGE